MASGSQRSGRDPSSSRESWWDVIEIVEEDGKQYLVRWAGKDPETGKPWPLEWVPNSHCSPDLIRDWEKKKAKAKKQESVASVSKYPVAFKRPSEKRAASTSDPTVPPTRKRKLSTPSGSLDNADEDSAHSRRKRLAVAVESTPSGDHGGQSTAPTHALLNRENRPTPTVDLPSHPPLEEIEMWVPTPNAKFGPPKRKRSTGERRDSPKEGPVDIAIPAITPIPTPIPLPSLSRPLILSESQIVALREEEEESQSQSQPTSNQPGGSINDSATSDPLQPTMMDAKGATKDSKDDSLGSLERPIGQPSADVQPANPNVNNGRGSEPSSQGVHSQSNVSDPLTQNLGVIDDRPTFRFNPLTASPMSLFNPSPSAGAISPSESPPMKKSMQGKGVNEDFTEDTGHFDPDILVFNSKLSASAISPSKPPQTEKSVKTGPPRIGKPGTSSIGQHSPSRSEPPRSGIGTPATITTLAKRRTFEARVRLDELRRAGRRFKIVPAKGQTTLKTSHSSEQPPPHVVFKRVMDGIQSPNGSQVTQLENSGNEISGSACPGGDRKEDPSESQEGRVINKPGQEANMGSLPRTGGVPALNVLVPSSEDEVPPTASDSTQSQSHDTSLHASLGSQLAAALDLLHKKSEEISELRIQANMLRGQADNGALRGKDAADYLATGVQTDRDNEAYKDWNLERTRWAEEKLALQGEAETLRGEKARALADADFFREQYQKASAFASTTRSENEELSARAALAESQATNGVALVRATFEGRVAKLEAEVQKYKALSEMLTERARRTDDDVRYRAALLPEFQREYRKLEGRCSELEAELEETKDELFDEKRTNSRLKRHVVRLESKEQAVDAGQSTEQEQEHMLWSDEKDEDYNPTRSPSSSPRGSSDRSSPRHQEGHGPHNENDARPTDGEIKQLDSFGLGESAQSSNDDMVYLCRWRSSEPAGYCDAVVGSKEELHEHVLSHHLACH